MLSSKNLIFPGIAFIFSIFISLDGNGQIDEGDVKFDYRSAVFSYDALIRKLEKPEKIYTNTSNTFKYNYPAQIDMVRGGYTYRGKLYCSFAKSQTEAEIRVVSTFGDIKTTSVAGDEAIKAVELGPFATPGGYIRNYTIVYPVTIRVYNKENLVKTIDFFTASEPLKFRLTKELVQSGITTYNTPFASPQEITSYESAGKVNTAAEKYAYFEAVRKVDEVIKNYFGTFDYDFEIGVMTVRKKKSGPYADLNEAAKVLEDAISAFKKKNLPVRDSLAKIALEKFTQMAASKEERISPVVQDMLNYNILVCHAVLGNFDKAEEGLTRHMATKIQRYETFSGNSINYFISVNKIRNKLQTGEIIHL
jgi:hypothetical protein